MMRRIGLDSEGREIVTWLVRNHLLMAEVATRRDLSDASVADNLATTCSGDAERLRLLYLLTIGDSRATGPAAWGTTKGALLRDLFVKAAAAIERGKAAAVADDRRAALTAQLGTETAEELLARFPDSYLLTFDVDDIVEHTKLLDAAPAVRFRPDGDRFSITIAAPDRPRLLATLAGALTVCGLDVIEANVFGTTDGVALDVFGATDPFGRLRDGVAAVERQLLAALEGEIDVDGARCDRAPRLPAARPRARSVRSRGRDRRVHDRHRSSKSTPTTRSDSSIGWPRRSPTSTSTCGSPRSRRWVRVSSTSSTSAPRAARRSWIPTPSTPCATRWWSA